MAKPMAMEEEINSASKSLVKLDNMFSEIISLIQLVNISPGIKIRVHIINADREVFVVDNDVSIFTYTDRSFVVERSWLRL
jgi:hypothetical protein